jgi:hypothetical protein
MRTFLTIVVPLLAPTALYFLYALIASRLGSRRDAAARDAGTQAAQGETPWPWLAGIGVVLMVIAVIFLAEFDRAPPGSTYIPPQLIDGVVVPAQIIPPGESAGE